MRKIGIRAIERYLLNTLIICVAVTGFYFITRYSIQSWSSDQKEWIGTSYSSGAADATIVDSKQFDTYEACASWGAASIAKQHAAGAYFTCGRDCSFKEDTITSGRRVSTYECAELINSSD